MQFRHVTSSGAVLLAVSLMMGCSSFSATIVKIEPDAGSATGGLTSAGGTSSSPSSSSAGTNVAIGGATFSAGGTGLTGGSSIGGGASLSGGSTNNGDSTGAIGGATSTGGTLASGGSNGGMPNTGGVSTAGGVNSSGGIGTTTGEPQGTGGSSTCANTQTDTQNCGICGHDCLSGDCVSGLCMPVVVATATSMVEPINLDDSNVYYMRHLYSPNASYYREAKAANSGAGTQLLSATGSASCVIGNSLYWSEYNSTDVKKCDLNNCVAPTSAWLTGHGPVIPTHVNTTLSLATVDPVCDTDLCISWWTINGAVQAHFMNSNPPPTGHTRTSDSFLAAGASVYWLARDYDSTGAFVESILYGTDSFSLVRSQLAGKMDSTVRLKNVNDYSALLNDSQGNLFRVSLPLGRGSLAPDSTGIVADTAIEDASRLYWADSGGTVYECTQNSCSSTATVRANGQSVTGPILQDAFAIYWGRGDPAAIMRLAK